jgi:hypothetical protein
MKMYRASHGPLIVLSLCGSLLGQVPTADAQELFDSIVQKFPASDTDHVVKNLPFARPRVLPGAIFTTSLKLPIAYGLPDDPQIISGPPTEYNGEVADEKRVGFVGELVSLFHASAVGGIVTHELVHLTGVRYLSMDYENLIKRVRNSAVAMQEMKRGRLPLVVSAAVVGRVTVSYVKGDKASAEAWTKFRKDTAEVGGNVDLSSTDMVSVSSTEPIIVAFETRTVSFDWDTADLTQRNGAGGNGQPTPPIKLSELPFPTTAFAMRETAEGVEFADVSSSNWAAVDPTAFVKLVDASKTDPKGINAIGSWAKGGPETFPAIMEFAAENPKAFAYIGAGYAGTSDKKGYWGENKSAYTSTDWADVGKFGYSNPQALLTAADWAKSDPQGFGAVVKLGKSNPMALKVWGNWAEQDPEQFQKFASSNELFTGYTSPSGSSDWSTILTSVAISHPKEFESVAKQVGVACTK